MTTILTDDRETAVRVGYFATDWTYPIDFDRYVNAVKDWDIKAINRDGECIGAVYTKDGERHVSVVPEWRCKWITKGLLRQLLDGAEKTKVTPGHEHVYGMLRRLGYRSTDDGSLVKGV